jgi:glucose-1-phosphate thymidylyltransferase
MTTTRALVLARGLGRRMQSVDPGAALTDAQKRAADAGLKAMMPIADRPFLDFVLSAIADAGLRRVGIVVAPDHGSLRDHYAAAPPSRLDLAFIVQEHPMGTADAVVAAEPWSNHEPFLTMNGDNLYPADVLREVAALDEPGLPGFEAGELIRSSNIEPARVHAFALIGTDASGYLTRIVEKPSADEAAAAGTNARVSMNCWRFDSRIFEACRDVPRSPRGEFELPVAVGLAASRGVPFKVVMACGPVLDLSQRADAAEVTRRLSGVIPQP